MTQVKIMQPANTISLFFLVAAFTPLTTYSNDDSPPKQKPDFQRLFTTSEQRLILNQHRLANATAAFGPPVEIKKPQPSTLRRQYKKRPKSVRFSGVLYRADGTRVNWINGKAYTTKESRAEAASGSRSVTDTVSAGAQKRTLKPGQTWDVNSGKIRDGY